MNELHPSNLSNVKTKALSKFMCNNHSPAQISAQIGHDLKWFTKRRLLFAEKATFTKLSVSKEVKG